MDGKSILISSTTGSFGKEFIRTILNRIALHDILKALTIMEWRWIAPTPRTPDIMK